MQVRGSNWIGKEREYVSSTGFGLTDNDRKIFARKLFDYHYMIDGVFIDIDRPPEAGSVWKDRDKTEGG